MDINKKFKFANIGLLALTVMFLLGSILTGVFSFVEKNNVSVNYQEYTDISYLINGKYTQDDKVSFASGEISSIVVTVDYYNNNKENRGHVDATATTYIKTKDFSDQTVYGAFGSIEYIENELLVEEDKTTIVYNINYQAYQTKVQNYISDPNNNIDADVAAGKLDLALVATSKDETQKEALISISLLEDVVTISISKTIAKNESFLDSNYKVLLIIALGCFCLALLCGVCLFISYKLSKMDNYERGLFIIFKLNKGILVESDLSDIDNGFVVKSFKELLKVQNSVSLPILYSKSDSNVRFVIKVGNSVYSYTISK